MWDELLDKEIYSETSMMSCFTCYRYILFQSIVLEIMGNHTFEVKYRREHCAHEYFQTKKKILVVLLLSKRRGVYFKISVLLLCQPSTSAKTLDKTLLQSVTVAVGTY